MDLFLSSSLLIGFLFIPTFLIFFFFYEHKTNNPTLPPGKIGWPVIGESLQMVSAGRSGQPERFVNERMNKYSSEIFKTSIGGDTTAILCGPSGNKFLFSNEDKLVVSCLPPNVEKLLSPPNTFLMNTTKKLRKTIPEFVKPEALQKYVPIMDYTTRNEEKKWSSPSREVKVFNLSKNLTFSLACKLFMSVEDPGLVARLADTFDLVITGIISMPINLPGTAFNRAMKAGNLLREELSLIAKQRRNDLSKKKDVDCPYDFLSKILTWTDEEGKYLNEMEIPGMILGMLFASYETTSTLMTSVVYYLADHPDVYAKVLEGKQKFLKVK